MKKIYSIALIFLIIINSKLFSQLKQPWSNSYLLSFSGGGHLHDITNNYQLSSMLTNSKRSSFFSRINYPADINSNSFMTMSKFKDTFFSIIFESVKYGEERIVIPLIRKEKLIGVQGRSLSTTPIK